MNRQQKVLARVKKDGRGLEIGASFSPFAPKREGYQTHVIDHLAKEDLIEKYRAHDMPVQNVEAVDFVWRGESYAELTGNKKYYDWVIASHLIEHTPDLIGFINSCQEVLKDDGVLSLVVPDARYCFDCLRPLSGISKIIDAHLQENKTHTVGTIAEFSLNAVKKDSALAWDEMSVSEGETTFVHSSEDSKTMIGKARGGEYVDSHCWCFTPTSFRLLIHDLNSLGFIELKEVEFFPTEGCEFFITLAKNGGDTDLDRMAYLKKIREESWFDVDLGDVIRQRVADKVRAVTFRLRSSLKYRLSFLKKGR